jgi:colicin import membrane protein
MVERASDRWVSIALSVLLHGTLVGVLVYGFWNYHQSRPQPTLAIEATVVDARSVNGAALKTPPQPQPQPPAPAPVPPPPVPEPVEPTGPPEPTPEELAQREQALKEQAEKEQARKEQAQQEAVDKQHRVEQQKQQEEADHLAQEKQAQKQREAQEKTDAERKAVEARKRQEEQRLAEQKRAEAAQREADEKSKAEREAELKSSLAAEEHSMAVRQSGALASWQAQITARIQHAWLRPPSARPGITCVMTVTQVPGGAVVNVRIESCNGDQAVRESIEAAAYRASPLPPPPDPSLFERVLEITFRPD